MFWGFRVDPESCETGEVFSCAEPVVRRRFGRGFIRRSVGNSGTSKMGDVVPLYMMALLHKYGAQLAGLRNGRRLGIAMAENNLVGSTGIVTSTTRIG